MAKQPTKTGKKPNLYQVSGDGIHVTYSTSGFDGKPHFSYQDATRNESFTGDGIRTVQTEIGTLVTVTIRLTIDSGSTSFTLFVPNVNLRFGDSVPITTEGITTVHLFSIIGPPNGQTQSYESHQMQGTAAWVVF